MNKIYQIQILGIEAAAKLAEWGTFGPFQRWEDFKFVKLIDCSTEHLVKIKEQLQKTPAEGKSYIEIINYILNSRK